MCVSWWILVASSLGSSAAAAMGGWFTTTVNEYRSHRMGGLHLICVSGVTVGIEP